ncbi:hypothetical protein [Granulicella pectinivorans]|uniref:hypothetical protein n=1 Tax=Granulicella pectinivorans TaxID=474950 RepID=UPI000B7ED650|nr:hypothetical protein [Granulicella pectinivorans]
MLYVVSLLTLASVLRHQAGFPLDDSYIHQVIARNMAETHVVGFQPGRASSGSSSLVWTMILTAGDILLGRVSPVWFCLALSVCVMATIGFVLMRLTQQDGLSGAAAWAIALAPALSGNFQWLGLIGMEHLLFLALMLLLLEIWLRPLQARSAATPFQLFLLCFLMVLTRLEGVFLIGAVLGCWRFADRRMKNLVLPGVGTLAGLVVSLGWNWKISGQWMPASMRGRQFLYMAGYGRLDIRVRFLWDSCRRMLMTWSIGSGESGLHGGVWMLSLLLLGGLVLFGIRELMARHARRWIVLVLCAFTVEAAYLFVLPAAGHGGRYIALPMMVCMSLASFGLHALLTTIGGNRKLVGAGVGIACGLTLCLSQRAWMRASEAEIEQIRTEHGVMAAWMQENLPAETFTGLHLAAFDIGRIGYQFRGRIVDLGALVDSHFLPYLRTARTGDYLREHDVRYVVLPMTDQNDRLASVWLALDPEHGVELTLVHTVCADRGIAELAWIASGTALPCQYLYSIRYVTPVR